VVSPIQPAVNAFYTSKVLFSKNKKMELMSTPSLLLVEDNPDHLELTLAALEECGESHVITTVSDGKEALAYLFCEGKYSGRSSDEPPELVLLDLGLPGMSGLEVMRHMRADPRTFFVPIVMLTSANENSKAVMAFKGGLNSFVSKPLHYRDFLEKLAQVREYWRSSNFAPLANSGP
jgi:CheY-like chemotaxis protein